MKKNFFFLFLLAVVSCSNGNTGSNETLPIKGSDTFLLGSIMQGHPVSGSCEQILEYTGFHLCYNEEYEQASWVAYILTKDMIKNSIISRTNDYRGDDNIKSGSAQLNDYRRSGYTRGHLAPAGAMKWSEDAMSESFLLSNMSPQLSEFNSGIWEVLERKVRHWAHQEEAIYVVTGPVLTSFIGTIGYNEVAVPEYYYKVILDIQPPGYKGIGFIIRNEKAFGEIFDYSLSIDAIEHETGIDFFSSLPDSLEMALESHFDPVAWE